VAVGLPHFTNHRDLLCTDRIVIGSCFPCTDKAGVTWNKSRIRGYEHVPASPGIDDLLLLYVVDGKRVMCEERTGIVMSAILYSLVDDRAKRLPSNARGYQVRARLDGCSLRDAGLPRSVDLLRLGHWNPNHSEEEGHQGGLTEWRTAQ
jgi:hypothetical protein